MKNRFGGIFDHFLGKAASRYKINATFLIKNFVLIIVLFNIFWKKSCIFREDSEKSFLGAESLLKRKGRLIMKMNITFFMENEVLNMFSSNNFFGKRNIFWENGEKQFWGCEHLLGDHLRTKNNITLFIANYMVNIFMWNNISVKSSVF